MKNRGKFVAMTTALSVASAGLTAIGMKSGNRAMVIGGAAGWAINAITTQAVLAAKLNAEIKACERYKDYVHMEWATNEIEILNDKTRKIIAIKAKNRLEAAEAIKELTDSLKKMEKDGPISRSVTLTERG